jgi:hypothetical protein
VLPLNAPLDCANLRLMRAIHMGNLPLSIVPFGKHGTNFQDIFSRESGIAFGPLANAVKMTMVTVRNINKVFGAIIQLVFVNVVGVMLGWTWAKKGSSNKGMNLTFTSAIPFSGEADNVITRGCNGLLQHSGRVKSLVVCIPTTRANVTGNTTHLAQAGHLITSFFANDIFPNFVAHSGRTP